MLLKHTLGISIFVSISYFFGRFWFLVSIAAMHIPVLIIHGWWLPKTASTAGRAEPKDKYYELRGWKRK